MQGRRDFMKTSCTLAACSCPAAAEQRFAYLLEAMDDHRGKKTRIKVMETVGRRCISQYMELTEKFRGHLKGYLDEIQKQWVSRDCPKWGQ